jgi:hypothetical protein
MAQLNELEKLLSKCLWVWVYAHLSWQDFNVELLVYTALNLEHPRSLNDQELHDKDSLAWSWLGLEKFKERKKGYVYGFYRF